MAELAPGQGFLPAEPCIERLTAPGWRDWEDAASSLPELNKTQRIAEVVQALPEVAVSGLEPAELRRACVLACVLVHSYVNGPTVPWSRLPGGIGDGTGQRRTRVPTNLARGFLDATQQLGLPPVLVATVADIWNCVGPVGAPAREVKGASQMRLLTSMTGTSAELGFHAVPGVMHRVAAPLVSRLLMELPRIVRAEGAARYNGAEALLRQMTATWRDMRDQLELTWSAVDQGIWWDVYRPLLGGFHPDGITLCGCGKGGSDLQVSPKGPSAGQSTMIALFDTAVGVRHTGEALSFQEEMLEYMPRVHADVVRRLRSELAANGVQRGLRSIAQEKGAPRGLRDAFTEVLKEQSRFRSVHMKIASTYIQAGDQGTGASSFKDMLRETLDATAAAAKL
eukprot:Hpha_TRINITY_DN36027_c0_g1::TRINITY_DN36027_c0_g1_i1::g.170740::m.170740/K00463/IDO, INDO; indoleamine 2,3-dioxygenase